MASTAYTLHVAPFAVPGDPGALDRAEIVRDGFSWGAFLVPGLWLLLHRCWVAGIAAFVVVIGLGAMIGTGAAGLLLGALVWVVRRLTNRGAEAR